MNILNIREARKVSLVKGIRVRLQNPYFEMLRPVDSTILFFQGDLVVVISRIYARESNGIYLLIILRPFVMDSFVLSRELIKVV